MKLSLSEQEIIEIIQKDKINYQGIFDLIFENKIVLTIDFINQMQNAFNSHFHNQLSLLNEEAKIDHLNESIKDFESVMNHLISDYSPIFITDKLTLLKKNIVGTLKKRIKFLEGYENKKLAHPIKLNCDSVILAALFLELSQEIFEEKKEKNQFERRLAMLISDNFESKRGTRINIETIYKEMTEGGGISERAKQNLIAILNKIVKKIN
jgi:hypothetical protein